MYAALQCKTETAGSQSADGSAGTSWSERRIREVLRGTWEDALAFAAL